nr:unnamed protein product [Digitaria exilis]
MALLFLPPPPDPLLPRPEAAWGEPVLRLPGRPWCSGSALPSPQPLHFVQVRLCAYIPSPDPAQCGSLRHWEEIEFPCSNLGLYSVKRLKLQMRKKEPAHHSVAGTRPTTRSRTLLERQTEAGTSQMPSSGEPGTSQMPPPNPTANMTFEQTYDYFQGGSGQYTGTMPGYGQDPGYYYSGGMGSYGPQVGPSTSARYDYENPFTREISHINTRLSELYQQQQQMNQDMAHNTDLT